MINTIKEQNYNILSLLQGGNQNPLSLIVIAVILAIIPLFLFSATSYLKISIVLNIVKNGFGVQQLPSTAITGIISLILSLYVMQPILTANLKTIEMQPATLAGKSKALPLTFLQDLQKPWVEFLLKNSGIKEREFFLNISKSQAENIKVEKNIQAKDETLVSLLPSFMISQLKQAFSCGLILYLPIVAIDIIVVNILISLGLSMISPNTLTLPLKLFLFVVSDAWLLLSKSLILSFN